MVPHLEGVETSNWFSTNLSRPATVWLSPVGTEVGPFTCEPIPRETRLSLKASLPHRVSGASSSGLDWGRIGRSAGVPDE